MKLRPQLILLLFTLIVLAHNLRVPATYLYYITATDDFIERLCENKDRPELNCDGKCYLAKMLQEADTEENPLPKEHFSWPKNILFVAFENKTQPVLEEPEILSYGSYINFYHLLLSKAVFHPPNAVAA
ncbi:hypothetical protein [Robertkochia sediminum]|uniref:hypothetical protein n=1 Tax=Robertkochia sediminum TaxID=2785326 RepID=UPI001931A003|nr:hypothetical protein [Robertkochia sediminum]MBL7471539.1 hypothetical protein [Robertkochia sediminum]